MECIDHSKQLLDVCVWRRVELRVLYVSSVHLATMGHVARFYKIWTTIYLHLSNHRHYDCVCCMFDLHSIHLHDGSPV